MRWSVVAVGKSKEPFYRDASAAYLERLGHYRAIALHEVPEARRVPGREAEASAQEGAALLKAAGEAVVVALDERGDLLDTAGTVRKLADLDARGSRGVAFLLGGPSGHAPEVLERCAWKWSLSPLTLPYQLARVVLLEQLYRCETIRKGEPYHRV